MVKKTDGNNKMKILLYPDDHTHKKYKIAKIKPYIETMGIELAKSAEDNFDLIFYQSYHKYIRKHDDFLREMSKKYDIINIGGDDTTKTRNEKIMKQVFGYNSIATSEDKVILEKSEKQGAHDITVVDKIRNKPNFIYVKMIDNRVSDDTVRDLRIFVFDYKVKAVIIKDKPIEKRFGGAVDAVIRWDDDYADYLLTEDEIDKIEEFCRVYETHYAEIDACRDTDGRLYIVDNNNVPSYSMRMRELFERDNKKYLQILSKWFYEMLKNHTYGSR